MSRPDFYPHRPEKVDVVQTHISFIFIAGNEVYKVKKAVDFGFLDFTTIEKRKFYCEEELRLNRRLAPETYLGVVPIAEDATGALQWGKRTHRGLRRPDEATPPGTDAGATPGRREG